jgi:hypothetical protein
MFGSFLGTRKSMLVLGGFTFTHNNQVSRLYRWTRTLDNDERFHEVQVVASASPPAAVAPVPIRLEFFKQKEIDSDVIDSPRYLTG